MVFNSIEFAIFLPIVVLLFYLLPQKLRWVMLLAASCVFYMWFVPKYILILLVTIVIDFSAGILMEKHAHEPKKKKTFLVISIVSTLLVLFTLNIPSSILTESSLSFLGLGIQPPNASWGLMINTGRQYLYNAPWLCFAPGAAIMLIVLAFNFLGNGLLDVLDPRMKKQ